MTVPTLEAPEIAARIQHTRIAPGMTASDIEQHCSEAVRYGFNAVMIPGSWVGLASRLLAGTPVLVASAVDFPIVGSMSTRGKVAEAVSLVSEGADQLDIGVGIGWLKSGQADRFRADIAAVVSAAGVPVKVMLELPLLDREERELAVRLAVEAGVAFVKNASGGALGPANPADIAFLRSRVPDTVLVKASGAIQTLSHAVDLLDRGAALLGTSSGIRIISGDLAGAGSSAY